MATVVEEHRIDHRIYTFCAFDGRVAEASRQRETLVSSSGSGQVNRDFTGKISTIDPVHISSQTIVHDEFFLLDEETGEERYVHLQNWQLNSRVGHHVQIFWIVAPKQTWGAYIGVYNKNLQESEWKDAQILAMLKNQYKMLKWGGVVSAVVLGIVFKSFWLFLFILIGSYWFYQHKANTAQKEVNTILKQMLMRE